jgi:hypothetical protein
MLCASCGSAAERSRLDQERFKLGRDDQVVVEIPAVNKGVGTTPEQLNVSFNIPELQVFLGVEELALPPQALGLLERRDCHGDMGNAVFSVRISGSLDHGIKRSFPKRGSEYYRDAANPTERYGLLDYGPTELTRGGGYEIDYLFLPQGEHPYGFRMSCGHLNSPLDGGCVIERDVHRQVTISYVYCEVMLPYWREIDRLYFEIVNRAVVIPQLSKAYKL